MRFQQRLPIARDRRIFLRVLPVRYRQAEPAGELADRFSESDLVVELDELDDVPGDPAAETLEIPLVAMDVERGRLLSVKRT